MKITSTEKLLHDLAAEIEGAFSSVGPGDYVIEIPITDARKLMRRYEAWRKRTAALKANQEGRR